MTTSMSSPFTWDHVLYRLYDCEAVLLYVGRTRSIRRRFKSHAAQQSWWCEVDSCRVEFLPDYESLCEAERLAIQTERPRENLCHNLGRMPPRPQDHGRSEARSPGALLDLCGRFG